MKIVARLMLQKWSECSNYDGSFKYITQLESSSAAVGKEEEEVGSSNGVQERNFKDMGWFLQVQKASMSYLLHPNRFVFS